MIALALLWSCCRALFRDEKAALAVDRALPALFVILALPLMIFIALAVPPGQSPDEPNHVVRVASVAHGQITGRRGRNYWVRDHFEPQTDVKLNLGTAEVAWLGTNPQQYYGAAVQAKIRAVPWSSRTYVSDVPNTGTYPPFLYIPAATGLALVRLLGGTPYEAFIAERCAGALTYTLLGFLALMLARRGKLLLFVVLMLPAALWLGGTVHQDGVMIGLAVLAVALLTGAEASPRRVWWAAAALCLIILARPPLIPLALLIGVPLGFKRSTWAIAIAAVPGLLWALLVVPRVSVPFFFAHSYLGGPLWQGAPKQIFYGTDPLAQAKILLSHPGRLLTLPLVTMLAEWNIRLGEMFGVVGALDLVLPDLFRECSALAMLAAIAGLGRDGANRRLPWLAFGIIATVFLIYDAQYISWTHVGSELIEGVQGRYLLELVPFLALAGASRPAQVAWNFPAIVLAACSLVVVPVAVIGGYYVK